MKSRRIVVGLLMVCMMLSLAGCGSKAMNDMAFTESVSMSRPAEMKAESQVFYDKVMIEEDYAGGVKDQGTGVESGSTGGKSSDVGQNAVQENRKLIKTVDMTVETKEFDRTLAALEGKIAELGGYIENLETYNGSSYSSYRSTRNANMTIRIPKQKLDVFLETVEGVSNVVRRSESVEDVTLTYVDLESHKKVLLAEQERLLELIKKAEAIEDIITIENRLSTVRYQIESMEAQLRTYDNKVDYSTVHLTVNEVKELTPVVEKNALERIADGFVDSLKDIGEGITEFSIWFVVNIPYFVLWIIILIVGIFALRVLLKVLRAGKAKKRNCMFEKKQASIPASKSAESDKIK